MEHHIESKIVQVTPGSMADRRGVKAGQYIVRIAERCASSNLCRGDGEDQGRSAPVHGFSGFQINPSV